MKKLLSLSLVALTLLSAGLVSCGQNNSSSPISSSPISSSAPATTSVTPKVSVTLDKTTLSVKVAEKKTITATTNPVGGTVLFSSSDETIAKVTKTGEVEDIPVMPTDPNAIEIPLTSPSLDSAHKTGYSATYANNLAHIAFTADSISTEYWQNTAIFNLASGDYTRKSEFHLIGRGSDSFSIYYKLLAGGDTVSEGELSYTTQYSNEKIDLAAATRYRLGSVSQLLIYAPKPGTYTKEGSFDIAHAYLSGDKDPGVAPGEYDPSQFSVLYSFPIGSPKATFDSFGMVDDQITGNCGNCTVEYAKNDGIVVTNKDNFNDWGCLALKMPEYDNGTTLIDYTGATKRVIKVNASLGAFMKYRAGWSGDLIEKTIKAADADKDIYLQIDLPDGVTPWQTIFDFAPLYRDSSVTTDITVTIKSLQIVKPKA